MMKKVFGKIQHPFMTKALMKICVKELYLNIIKASRASRLGELMLLEW
jgi:hypothetical protein